MPPIRQVRAAPTSAKEIVTNAAEATVYAWSAGVTASEFIADPDIMEFCQQISKQHLNATLKKQALEKVAVDVHNLGTDRLYVVSAQQVLIKILKVSRTDH